MRTPELIVEKAKKEISNALEKYKQIHKAVAVVQVIL